MSENDVITDQKAPTANPKILKKQITCVGTKSNIITQAEDHSPLNSLNRTNSLCVENNSSLLHKNDEETSTSLELNGD